MKFFAFFPGGRNRPFGQNGGNGSSSSRNYHAISKGRSLARSTLGRNSKPHFDDPNVMMKAAKKPKRE